MINTIIKTKRVNVREEIENIDKDLGCKTDNVKWTFLFQAEVEGKYF